MAALDAERYLDHLPVVTLEGDEVTIEANISPRITRRVIEPDGTICPTRRRCWFQQKVIKLV